MKKIILSLLLCLTVIVANGSSYAKYLDRGFAYQSKDCQYVAFTLFNHEDSEYRIVKAEMTCYFVSGTDIKKLNDTESLSLDPGEKCLLMFTYTPGIGYSYNSRSSIRVYYSDGTYEDI